MVMLKGWFSRPGSGSLFFFAGKVWPCPASGAWVAPKTCDLQVVASCMFLHVAAKHPSLRSGKRYFLSGSDHAAFLNFSYSQDFSASGTKSVPAVRSTLSNRWCTNIPTWMPKFRRRGSTKFMSGIWGIRLKWPGKWMNGAEPDKWLYEPIGRHVRRIVLPAVVTFAIAALSLRRL